MSDIQPTLPSMSIPSWALPIMLIALGAGGGYFSNEALSSEQPAVLAVGVEKLSEDVKEIKEDLKEVRILAREGASDRWTKTDQDGWVNQTYAVDKLSIDKKLTDIDSRLRALERGN